MIVSRGSLGFLACTFDLRFQNKRKSSRWKPQERFWLDKEERLFPGSDYPGQKQQEQAVRLLVHRSLDLSMQDDQLLPQQGIFCQQFGFASGQISEGSEYKGGRSWLHPLQDMFLKRLQAARETLLE